MNYISSYFTQKYTQFYRHAFKINPTARAWFKNMEDLISHSKTFIDYIKLQYSLIVFYNFLVALPSLIYLSFKFSLICQCDLLSSLWLAFVTIIKLIETIVKLFIIYETIDISNPNNDLVTSIRRLFCITKTNIFVYNNKLSQTLFCCYTVYFLIKRTGYSDEAIQLYCIINCLIIGFCIRFALSVANYILSFKLKYTQEDTDGYQVSNNKLSNETLKMIKNVILTEKNIDDYIPLNDNNEKDICCICMLEFIENEVIKIMPCNNKHLFHKCCIDKWLINSKVCPTCKKDINKELIKQTKSYYVF